MSTTIPVESPMTTLINKIHGFIEQDDKKGLEEYLEEIENSKHAKVDLHALFIKQFSALLKIALDNGSPEIIESLLQYDAKSKTKCFETFCRQSFTHPIQKLLDKTFDATTKESKMRIFKTIEVLLENGAILNEPLFLSLLNRVVDNQTLMSNKLMPWAIERCEGITLQHLIQLSTGSATLKIPVLKLLAMCDPHIMPDPKEIKLKKYQNFYVYYKEVRDRMMLAHHWGLGGYSELSGLKFELDYSQTAAMFSEMTQSYVDFSNSKEYRDVTKSIHANHFASASDMQMQNTLSQISEDIQSIKPMDEFTETSSLLQKIQEGGLVCIPIATRLPRQQHHAQGLVFAGDKQGDKLVVRCYWLNRLGDKSGVTMAEVGTISALESFLEYLKPHLITQRINITDAELKAKLKDLQLKEPGFYIQMENQKNNDCTWILMKLFLRAISFDRVYRLSKSLSSAKHAELGCLTETNEASQVFYKAFAFQDRQSRALRYVTDHQDPKSKMPADTNLLGQVYTTALYFQKIKHRPVDSALLDNMTKTFPEIQSHSTMEMKLLANLMSHIAHKDIIRIREILKMKEYAEAIINRRHTNGYTPLASAKRLMDENPTDPEHAAIYQLLIEAGASNIKTDDPGLLRAMQHKISILIDGYPSNSDEKNLLANLKDQLSTDPGLFDYINASDAYDGLLPSRILKKGKGTLFEVILPFITNLNAVSEGYSLLHLAIQNKLTTVALALIDRGANLTLKTPQGRTALELAKSLNLSQVVLAISEKEKEHKAKDEKLKTGIHHAYKKEEASNSGEKLPTDQAALSNVKTRPSGS